MVCINSVHGAALGACVGDSPRWSSSNVLVGVNVTPYSVNFVHLFLRYGVDMAPIHIYIYGSYTVFTILKFNGYSLPFHQFILWLSIYVSLILSMMSYFFFERITIHQVAIPVSVTGERVTTSGRGDARTGHQKNHLLPWFGSKI